MKPNVRGILFMLAAIAVLSIMDAALKSLVAHYPPIQTACLRGLFSLPFILLFVIRHGGFAQVLHGRISLHVLRAVLGVSMLASFIYAISVMSLADAYAVFFIGPLLITALSVPILKEKVSTAQWIAISFGLIGVLLMLRPQGKELISLGALASFAAALMYAVSALLMRVLGRTESTVTMTFWFVTLVSVLSLTLSLPNWVPIIWTDWPWLLTVGICGALGQYLITEAFRSAQPSVVAPFEYTAMLWGLGFDFVLWSALPGAMTMLGASVVIGSGLYLLRQEAKAHH